MTGPGSELTQLPPPPPGTAASSHDPRTLTRRQRDQHSGTIDRARRGNRRAAARLIVTPEWMALTVGCILLVATLSPSLLTFLMAMAVAAVFGWLHLSSGDGLVATVLVGGLGFLSAAVLGDSLGVEGGRLWWVLPGLVMASADAAITYNHYRRRDGGVDRRIPQLAWSNLVLVAAMATGLAWVLQRIADRDDRITWPWFALVSIALATTGVAGPVWLRRRALPADRRRYSPGRRLLPPPR